MQQRWRCIQSSVSSSTGIEDDNVIDKSVKRFRQRSQNGYESSYVFLSVVKEQQEYTLPDEIEEVRQVFRRSVGSGSNETGTQFEPFEAAFQNTYLLQSGRIGGMATYEMYYQYQELSARLFGGFINFEFNPVTKKINILRKFSASGEQLVLWTYNLRPESRLLQDRHAGPWIQDYALALAKITANLWGRYSLQKPGCLLVPRCCINHYRHVCHHHHHWRRICCSLRSCCLAI